jgi:hypothetical protein
MPSPLIVLAKTMVEVAATSPSHLCAMVRVIIASNPSRPIGHTLTTIPSHPLAMKVIIIVNITTITTTIIASMVALPLP